jgi:hypothetical protein
MSGKYEDFLKDNGALLYSSQSEAELGLCELIAFYTTNPAQIDRIFRRSKLYREKWEREDYREDTIKLAVERTSEHYSGVWADSEAGTDPAIRTVTKDDPKDTIGVHPCTGAVNKVVDMKMEGIETKFLAWVSDCAVHIHTETKAKDDAEFTFVGNGAIDKRAVKFTMSAISSADPRKFKAALVNAFGAKNRVGKLSFEMVQALSLNPRVMERIETPAWKENIPLLPGVGLIENVEFRLSSKIPATVYDGDLDKAKEILRKLLKVHKFTPILVASILGSPAITRWHKNDRFGLGLWGMTGTLKTTTVLTAMCVYGIGYVYGPKLKAGKAGSTSVGAMEVFAAAGFLPQIYDDVKTVDSKDYQNYVSVMHGVLEGEEKARGKKDGGLRESRDFTCIPIPTGEVRPQEASTTARVLNLNWSDANGPLLTEVQANAALLPVIGYHWLRFLAGTDHILGKDYEAFRSKKMGEFSGLGYTNPGRLATIYSLLVSVWDLLETSSLGDVFTEARESFKAALVEATATQGAAVTEETEIARFLSALEELLASNPSIIQSIDGSKTIVGAIIGKRMEKGLFLLPTETLNELMKIRAFNQQPTIDSITQALNEKGLLIHNEKEHLKYRCRLNGGNPRGWYIKAKAFPVMSDVFPPTENGKNNGDKSNVPGFPVYPVEKRENINEKILDQFGDQQNTLHKTTGNTGNRDNREIDSDFDSNVGVPGSVPGDTNVGNTCDTDPPPSKDEQTSASSANATHVREAEEQAKAKEEHFRKAAAARTGKQEVPGLQRFKEGVQSRSRNTCRLCGQHFETPLRTAYHVGGYICEPCRRDGPPTPEPPKDSQQKLEPGEWQV